MMPKERGCRFATTGARVSRGMPAFAGLADQDLAALRHYIRAVAHRDAGEPSPRGGLDLNEADPDDQEGSANGQSDQWDSVAAGRRKWWPTIEDGTQHVSQRMLDHGLGPPCAGDPPCPSEACASARLRLMRGR